MALRADTSIPLSTSSETETTRPQHVDACAWWRLWALAMLGHLIGNRVTDGFAWHGVVNLVAGLVALALFAWPHRRALRTVAAGLVVLSALVEAPFLPNHWWVAAAVSCSALLARPWQADQDFWRKFAPSGRAILLTFYSFAAFAKLNRGFFDPEVSCARHYTNRILAFWELPLVEGSSALASLLPLATTLIELAVPVLLLVRRTRNIGVWLAIGFHLMLTLDLGQHFFDFTLMLIPLFLLFAPVGTLASLNARWPQKPRALIGAALLGAMAMLIIGNLPTPVFARQIMLALTWLYWLILGTFIATSLLRPSALLKQSPADVRLKPQSVGSGLLVAVVLLNGLSPYLELKTATGFNMYANLITAQGETNHFLVPATAHLRDVQSDLVTIVSTNSEELSRYVDSGFDLPTANFRDYVSQHPDVAVTFEHEGETIELTNVNRNAWSVPMPWWQKKFFFFRAIPRESPAICQPFWFAAG